MIARLGLLRRALLGALLLVILSLVHGNMDLLSDSFWYIATGRAVLDTGHFPPVDPFSYTAMRTPWVVHMPGSVVLFAWLDRHFGLLSILRVCVLVETAALGVLWLSSSRSTAGRVALFPLMAFTVYLQRDDLCARGQVFGDLLFALLLIIAARFRDGRPVRWWIAPLLGAAWVNLHSSFLLGVLIPVIGAVGQVFDPREKRHSMIGPWVFAMLLALGTLVNPYGAALVRDVLTLASHPTTQQQTLFVSPDFWRTDTVVTFALAAVALAGCARSRETKGHGGRVLLLVALMCAAASGLRYLPLLCYVAISVLGPTMDQVLAEGIAHLRRSAGDRVHMATRAASVVAVVAAAVATGVSARALRTPKDPFAQVPIEAARFVQGHRLDNVVNDYHWGGFLLYVWQGAPKVFIDGRSHLYYNGVFQDALDLAAVKPGYGEKLELYEARTALLEAGSPLALVLEHRDGWTRVFEDRLSVVLRRPVGMGTRDGGSGASKYGHGAERDVREREVLRCQGIALPTRMTRATPIPNGYPGRGETVAMTW